MTRWHYKVEHVSMMQLSALTGQPPGFDPRTQAPLEPRDAREMKDRITSRVSQLGWSGWELVAAIPDIFDGGSKGAYLVFKRPAANQD